MPIYGFLLSFLLLSFKLVGEFCKCFIKVEHAISKLHLKPKHMKNTTLKLQGEIVKFSILRLIPNVFLESFLLIVHQAPLGSKAVSFEERLE